MQSNWFVANPLSLFLFARHGLLDSYPDSEGSQ